MRIEVCLRVCAGKPLHETALRLDPKNPRAHFNEGHALLLRGEPKGAIASMQEGVRLEIERAALESRPSDVHTMYTKLGESQYATGQRHDAEASFRKALEHNAKDAYAQDWLAFLRLVDSETVGALPLAEKAVYLDPMIAQAHFNLGRARFFTGDGSGAIIAFREANRLNPNGVGYKATLDSVVKSERGLIAPPPREVKR